MSAQLKLAHGLSEYGPLCVGLDPDPERMPTLVRGDVAAFLREIIAATSDLVCAYKINSAFFEGMGQAGAQALAAVRQAIPERALLIWDAKRGDIANTNVHYARSAFVVHGADAVTVHPYLGLEPLAPFLAYSDRLTFILCATSEGSALQDLCVQPDGEPIWEWVARNVARLSTGQCGLVVGATRPEQLRRVRELAPALPLLVPGVGAQGGALPAQPALVSVSRSILYASRGADFASAARAAAMTLRSASVAAGAAEPRSPALP